VTVCLLCSKSFVLIKGLIECLMCNISVVKTRECYLVMKCGVEVALLKCVVNAMVMSSLHHSVAYTIIGFLKYHPSVHVWRLIMDMTIKPRILLRRVLYFGVFSIVLTQQV